MERLERERAKTEDTIMRCLSKDKKLYIRKCQYCGTPLALEAAFGVCDSCYTKIRQGGKSALLPAKKALGKNANPKMAKAPQAEAARRHRQRHKRRHI